MEVAKVCILGGGGFVGRHIVHLLAEKRVWARVVTRNRERCKDLVTLPTVEVIEADVHNLPELQRQFIGMEAVINLVGILNGHFDKVHAELPRKVVQACLENRVARLLHMSALNADLNERSEYLRSKAKGEQAVFEASKQHVKSYITERSGISLLKDYALQVTVFRPSVIFGNGDSFLNLFARLVRIFPIIPLGSPHAKIQPVWVEDVACAFVKSLTNPATFGKSYNLCGPRVYTLRELLEVVCATLGLRRRIVGLSDSLSYLQAWVFEHLPGPIMTRDNYYSLQVDNVCPGAFPEVYGITPSALEAVVPDYLSNHTPRARYRRLRRRAGR